MEVGKGSKEIKDVRWKRHSENVHKEEVQEEQIDGLTEEVQEEQIDELTEGLTEEPIDGQIEEPIEELTEELTENKTV